MRRTTNSRTRSWPATVDPALIAGCVAALVVLTAAAATLGASPFAVLLFVALQAVLVVGWMLRPHGHGAFEAASFYFAIFLFGVLLLVLFVAAERRQSGNDASLAAPDPAGGAAATHGADDAS